MKDDERASGFGLVLFGVCLAFACWVFWFLVSLLFDQRIGR